MLARPDSLHNFVVIEQNFSCPPPHTSCVYVLHIDSSICFPIILKILIGIFHCPAPAASPLADHGGFKLSLFSPLYCDSTTGKINIIQLIRWFIYLQKLFFQIYDA